MKTLLKSFKNDDMTVKMYEDDNGFNDVFLSNQLTYNVEVVWNDKEDEKWHYGYYTQSGAEVKYNAIINGEREVYEEPTPNEPVIEKQYLLTGETNDGTMIEEVVTDLDYMSKLAEMQERLDLLWYTFDELPTITEEDFTL